MDKLKNYNSVLFLHKYTDTTYILGDLMQTYNMIQMYSIKNATIIIPKRIKDKYILDSINKDFFNSSIRYISVDYTDKQDIDVPRNLKTMIKSNKLNLSKYDIVINDFPLFNTKTLSYNSFNFVDPMYFESQLLSSINYKTFTLADTDVFTKKSNVSQINIHYNFLNQEFMLSLCSYITTNFLVESEKEYIDTLDNYIFFPYDIENKDYNFEYTKEYAVLNNTNVLTLTDKSDSLFIPCECIGDTYIPYLYILSKNKKVIYTPTYVDVSIFDIVTYTDTYELINITEEQINKYFNK